MAQARAVVYVVAAKTGAHQFLEQISLFIAAFGRAETGKCLRAMLITDSGQLATGQLQGFFPAGFTKNIEHSVRVHAEIAVFRRISATDQGLGQSLRVVGIVKAIATFDAQTLMVGRAVPAFDKHNFFIFDVIGQLATYAAKWADRGDLLVGHAQRCVTRRHQCASWAGLYAFATGDTGGRSHVVVHVKNNFRVLAAKSQSDDVIDLLITTGAQTACALDAGIQVDRHGRV